MWRKKSPHSPTLHSFLFDVKGLRFGSFNSICSTTEVVACPLVQALSGQTTTLATDRLVQLSYGSHVSARIIHHAYFY